MSKKPQSRHIDHEFSSLATTFEGTVRVILSAANRYLEEDSEASDGGVVLSLIDLFLMLCYKWLRNKYIRSEDKDKIRSVQAQIRDLRYDVFKQLNLQTHVMGREQQPIPLYLPTTSNKDFADKLERMGIKNAYRAGIPAPDPIEKLEGTMTSPSELAKIAETPPMTLYLPTTSDWEFAQKLARMGYKNAYRPPSSAMNLVNSDGNS